MHFYGKIDKMTGVTSGVGAACHSGIPKLAPWAFYLLAYYNDIIPLLIILS
jgi:hypothetical protein